MIKTVIDAQRDLARLAPPIEAVVHEVTNPDPLIVMATAPDSERAAAFRVLRHRVASAGNPRVILVSSPRAREGKSLCAANLAIALGECDRARVLLVEANLRSPRLAQLFRFQPPWCFADQLAAHRERPFEPWRVVEMRPFGIHVAAVDPRAPKHQLVDAPAFEVAMERLRNSEYDHIVIDAPPVIGTAEVNLLQDSADAVVLTTRVGRSRGRDLARAKQQLSPSPVLGVVLVEGEA